MSFYNESSSASSCNGRPTLPDYHEMQNLALLPGNPYAAEIDRLSSALMTWFAKQPKTTFDSSVPCGRFPYPGIIAGQAQEKCNKTSTSITAFDQVPQDSQPDW